MTKGFWELHGNERLSTIEDVNYDVVVLQQEKLVRKWKNGNEVERC